MQNEVTMQYMGGPPQVIVQQPAGYYNGQPYQQGYNPYIAQQQRQAAINAQIRAQEANDEAVIGAAVGGAAVAAGLCCCLQCCFS